MGKFLIFISIVLFFMENTFYGFNIFPKSFTENLFDIVILIIFVIGTYLNIKKKKWDTH